MRGITSVSEAIPAVERTMTALPGKSTATDPRTSPTRLAKKRRTPCARNEGSAVIATLALHPSHTGNRKATINPILAYPRKSNPRRAFACWGRPPGVSTLTSTLTFAKNLRKKHEPIDSVGLRSRDPAAPPHFGVILHAIREDCFQHDPIHDQRSVPHTPRRPR